MGIISGNIRFRFALIGVALFAAVSCVSSEDPVPGSIPWIELNYGPEAAFEAGLGIWGNAGRTPEHQYLVNNFESILVLYQLVGKMAEAGYEGYNSPEGYVGEWARNFNYSNVNNLAHKTLGTAVALQEHERVSLGLTYPPSEPLTTLLLKGLQGYLAHASIDYILRKLPVSHVELICPPKTNPPLELEFRNRRKGRYGTQEVHA